MTTDLPPVVCLSCACLEEIAPALGEYYKQGYKISSILSHQDAFFSSHTVVLVHRDFDSKEDEDEKKEVMK